MNREFSEKINENQGIIYKICRMYRTDPEDIRDLYQDIVLQLWRAWPSFKEESKLSSWIYRIALNTAITQFRKFNRIPQHFSISEDLHEVENSTDNTDYDETDLLNRAITKLTEIEKAIILLYMDDYSYKEIADMIGITESNVGFKINHVKKKLKTIINGITHGTE